MDITGRKGALFKGRKRKGSAGGESREKRMLKRGK